MSAYIRSEEGITLIEVVLAMTITALLTLGVGQMFSLGVKALQYSENNSINTVKKTTLNRTFVDDVAAATSFFIAGASPGTSQQMRNVCSTWTAAMPNFTDVRPLLTLQQGDGNFVAYEVRRATSGQTGQLWRVRCNSTNTAPQSNTQMLLLAGVALPLGTTDSWADAFRCSGTVTASTLTYNVACPVYTSIQDLTTNLGIRFTLPPAASVTLPVTSVVGSRSGV